MKCLSLDLRSSQSIAALIQTIAEGGIKIDVLVNNAGVFSMATDHTAFPRLYQATADLETNFAGVMKLT